MPAKDTYHDTVVRALEKEGWNVSPKQFTIIVGERHLWIDIQAVKQDSPLAILVEVKGFESASPVDFLASAIGKYVLYSVLLEANKMDIPLYMAVPVRAYRGILSEQIGLLARRVGQVKLVVFEPITQEIVEWIT